MKYCMSCTNPVLSTQKVFEIRFFSDSCLELSLVIPGKGETSNTGVGDSCCLSVLHIVLHESQGKFYMTIHHELLSWKALLNH